MKRFVLKVLRFTVCVSTIFCCVACEDNSDINVETFNETTHPQSIIITELNSPYYGIDVKITATEIKTIIHPSKDNRVIVGVRFIVENISDGNYHFRARGNTSFVDSVITSDVAKTSLFSESGEPENLQGGELTSGKSSIGYRCVEASIDSNSVEFRFEVNYSQNEYISFVFEIPLITEDE